VYIFRLWSAAERQAIARAEVAAVPVWAEMRAKYPRHPDIIEETFEKAVALTASNIHPLVILGLRRKLKWEDVAWK
jgi:hypothetical protein